MVDLNKALEKYELPADTLCLMICMLLGVALVNNRHILLTYYEGIAGVTCVENRY